MTHDRPARAPLSAAVSVPAHDGNARATPQAFHADIPPIVVALSCLAALASGCRTAEHAAILTQTPLLLVSG
jgi:hypothetical protein